MPTGRCYCGQITVTYTCEPKLLAICHCDNCKHYTGSLFSHNILVSNTGFQVIGAPKEYTVIADSGNSITNCFCGNCGTNLYRYGDSFGGINGDKVIQAGIMNDLQDLNASKPVLEMFVTGRVDWVHSWEAEGVSQFVAMPTSAPKEE